MKPVIHEKPQPVVTRGDVLRALDRVLENEDDVTPVRGSATELIGDMFRDRNVMPYAEALWHLRLALAIEGALAGGVDVLRMTGEIE